MLLTVWRHGEAGPGSPDRSRTLTEQGALDIEHGGRAFVARLQHAGLPLPSLVLFSRWLRTTQTAEGLCRALPGVAIDRLEALIPDSDAADVDNALVDYADREAHIVLVSHQPLVSALIDRCLGTRGEVPALAPGAYAVLETPLVAPGCATLLWWSAPPDYQV